MTDWTIAAALAWGSKRLATAQAAGELDFNEPSVDAKVLLSEAIGQSTTYLFTWPERKLTQSQSEEFRSYICLRETGQPVAHILGYRDFWSLRLHVTSDTLIPRPETEVLVECCLALDLPEHANILDLGTGTGAIALALASEQPKWRLTGAERSDRALSVAQNNLATLGFKHVELVASDWFSALNPEKHYDLIVSNPPYIDPDSEFLTQGDVRFEPSSALISPKHGMHDIERITCDALSFLNSGGFLVFEHGFDQGIRVRETMGAAGLVKVQTYPDLAGHDRVTIGQKAH